MDLVDRIRDLRAVGIFWAAAGIAVGLLIVPSVMDAGPGGGAVMQGIVRRKFPMIMTITGTIVILTGLRLYMVRFSWAWLQTPDGIVLTLGGILALGAYAIGVFVQRPTAQRLGVLAAEMARGGAADPARAAEMQALRARMLRVARLTAWHLAGAAALMAGHLLATLAGA